MASHNLVIAAREGVDASARATLNHAVQLAERQLADLVNAPRYRAVMAEVFGRDVQNPAFGDAVERMRAQLAEGALGVQVELVNGDALYGNAACYAAVGADGGERIYVNADWLAQCPSIEAAALVLLEETGHTIDQRINAGIDTPGDEGELFSYRVVGAPLHAAEYERIRAEDDSGVVQIDGHSVAVEFSVSTTNPGPFNYVDTSSDDGTFASQTGTLKTGGNNDKIQGIWNGSAYVSSIAVTNSAGTVTLGTLSLSAGAIGKGSTTNAGSWTFAPNSAAIEGLTSNELNRTVRIDAKSGQTTTSVTLAFNFYGAEDTPAGTSKTVTTLEDTSYTFSAADFGYTDRDAGDVLSAVRIDTLPSASAGTLQLAGVTVSAGQVIAAQDIGALAFVPAANANGTALGAFSFTVKDAPGNAYASTSSVMTLNVTPVNDAPTVSAPASFSIPEDVTAQLTYAGTPFADVDSNTLTVTLSVSDGAIAGASSAGIAIGGGATARTFTGSVTDLNAYFTTAGNITYTPALDNTASRTLTTMVSDGSAQSTATSTISIAAVNDAPALSAPSSAAVSYATGYTFAGGAISVTDPDAALLQISLSATHGTVTLAATSGLTFSSGGNASGAMTFTGAQSDVNTALHDLLYMPDSGYTGADALSMTANDLGQSGAGGALTDVAAISLTVLPNQAPVDTLPSAQTVAEDAVLAISGVSVNDPDGNLATVQLAVAHGTLSVSLAGGATIVDGANNRGLLKLGGSQAQINAALASLTYKALPDYNGGDTLTVTSSDSAGTPLTDTDTVAINVTPVADAVNDVLSTKEDAPVTANVLTGAGGASADTFSGSPVLTAVTQGAHGTVVFAADGTMLYTPDANWSGTDTYAYTVASGGVSETATVSVTVSAVNDAPTIAATATDPSYVAGAAAVQLFTNVQASTGPFDETAQTFTGVVIGVSGIAQQNSEWLTVDGTEFLIKKGVSGTTTGGHAISYVVNMASGGATSGTVTLTKAGGLSAAALDSVIAGMAYRYSAQNAVAGDRVFTISGMTDSGGTANGGVDTATPNIVSTVTAVTANTPPTLSVTALDPGYIEAAGLGTVAAPVPIFSNAVISTVEAGQLITGLTFTVSGVADGAYEQIVVDGTTVILQASSGITAANGLAYAVAVANGTASVSLSGTGVTSATMEAIIDGITYRNTNADDPTPGTRSFTITQLKDNGGTANGGSDTATLALSSSVAVNAADDAPTLTVTTLDPDYTEAPGVGTIAAPVAMFSNAAISAIEAGQQVAALTFTVTGVVDGAAEQIVVDGSVIALQAGSGITATHGLAYSVAVQSGTATVSLTSAGIAATAMEEVINGIAYQNASADNPTTGARVFTLTQLEDNGGTAYGGVDTTTLSIASIVTVNAVDDAPFNTVLPAQTVAEDTLLALNGISVTDLDANLALVGLDVEHGTLNVSIASGASIIAGANGSGVIKLSGTEAQINAALATLTYQGAADYNGSDTLTVTSSDSGVLSATNTVSIAVTAVADVAADVLGTMEDTAVIANVLIGTGGASADGFVGSPALSAVGPAAHGTVSFDADGTVRYTPQADWSGIDSFSYTAVSGGTSETGTVTVSVASVNDAPTMTATPLDPIYREAPGLGTIADAVYVFSNSAVTAVEGGQTIIGVTVRVDGLRDGVDERISIDGSAITLAADSSGVTAINGLAYTVTVRSGAASVSLTSTGVTPATLESVIDGIAYQNTNADAPTPGDRIFTIVALQDDGGTANGGADTSTLTLTSRVSVQATPDAPVNTLPGAKVVTEDTPLAITGLEVADPDENLASVALSVARGTLSVDTSAGAAITAGGNGSAMVQLAGTSAQINAALATLAYRAAADYNGADVLTVVSMDTTSLGATGTVAVSVMPAGDVVDDVLSGSQDTPLVANVLAGTGGASMDGFAGSPALAGVGLAAHGSVSFDADGTVRYTPQAGWSGTDDFTYTAMSGGTSETGAVTVNIAAAPVAPPPAPSPAPSSSTTTTPTLPPSTPQDVISAPTSAEPRATTPTAPPPVASPVVTVPQTVVASPAAPAPEFRPFDYQPRMPTVAIRPTAPPLVDYAPRAADTERARVPMSAPLRSEPQSFAFEVPPVNGYTPATLAPAVYGGSEADDRGFPVVRLPVLSGQLRGAGWMIDDVQGAGIAALFVYRGIHDTIVRPGQPFDIAIPLDAFAHTDPNAIVRMDVALGDGGALPDWLRFDRMAGRLIGVAPRAADVALRLAVIAHDNTGRAVETTFQLRTANAIAQPETGDGSSTDAAKVRGDLIGSEPTRKGERADEAMAAQRPSMRTAAPTFTEQLREARKERLYEKIFGVLGKSTSVAGAAAGRVQVADRLSLRR